jgi:hypothetical protein
MVVMSDYDKKLEINLDSTVDFVVINCKEFNGSPSIAFDYSAFVSLLNKEIDAGHIEFETKQKL